MTPRPPFRMKASRHAVLRCDGRFICGGRASFAWETFLLRRAAGVPGVYEIRRDGNENPWHPLDWSPDAAVEALVDSGGVGTQHATRMLRMREARSQRGLEVA